MCIYMCVCVCVCVCIYIYMYTHTHTYIYLCIYMCVCVFLNFFAIWGLYCSTESVLADSAWVCMLMHPCIDVICVFQQHGSVFWRKGARQTLNHLNPQKHLHHQLQVTTTSVHKHSRLFSLSLRRSHCLLRV